MSSLELTTDSALLSPPLWGRAGEGGSHERRPWGLPLSLALPHKGGGNAAVRAARVSAYAEE
jgi:hypothetical protein